MNIVKRVEEALDELYPREKSRSQYTVGALPGTVVITQDRPQRHCRSWYIPSDSIDRALSLTVYISSFISERHNVRPAFK